MKQSEPGNAAGSASRMEIIAVNGLWAAEFHGDHRTHIEDLFGQAILPTAFQVSVPRDEVVREVQARNPDCTVI